MAGGAQQQPLLDGGALQASLFEALPSVITSIGHSEFSIKLFDAIRTAVEAEYITVFVSDRQPRARILIAENEGSPGACRRSAIIYIEKYWDCDPANKIVIDGLDDQGIRPLRMTATDIVSAAYRSVCYHSLGLAKRFSLIQSRGEETIRVNLYFRSRTNLESGGFDQVTECAPLLMAAIWRHYDCAVALDRSNVTSTFRRRLEHVAPSLSSRELEVCSLIASGMTSEGIAIKLGLGVNTVLTYRKRGYARLQISSQNELMRLLM